MLRVKVKYIWLIFCISLVFWKPALAETDTLRIDFKGAERLFLENNLRLIAQKYHVEASKAMVKQAKLWDNPTLNTEQNLYDNTHQLFNHSNGNGEFYAVISQVFKTAGKRGKQIQMARNDASIQEAAFNDLMRNLRYNLFLDLDELAKLNDQNELFRMGISSLTDLVGATEKLYKAGNMSLRDEVRLKALLFSQESDLAENQSQANTLQSELQTLLGVSEHTVLMPLIPIVHKENLPALDSLIAIAKRNRGDYQISELQLVQAHTNLNYQKSLRIPDVTAGIVYDRINSYAPHYFGLQLGIPIPLFDRNQGNIKAAQLSLKGQESELSGSEAELRSSVAAAVRQYELCRTMLSESSEEFYQKYNQLFNSMLKSYQQRQISLIEFTDFFDSYRETRLKILEQQYNFQKSIATLNYSVGATVVNP